MGVAYYLVFERPASFDTFVDGKALAGAEVALEKLCKKLKVRPLSHFAYVSDEEFGDLLGDEDSPLGSDSAEESKWFDPTELLETVQALIGSLQANQKSVPNSPAVLADLRQYEAVISKAREAGLRFRISIDI